jgi:hypothetical protein
MPAAARGGLSNNLAPYIPKLYVSVPSTYGTKMAEAVAPASLTASATVANTGSPKCSCPAFLGFVPPTTVVPSDLSDKLEIKGLKLGYHNQLLVEHGIYTLEVSKKTPVESLENIRVTHVPCLPVKPWKTTLVSLLMRRFSIVAAYPPVLVE